MKKILAGIFVVTIGTTSFAQSKSDQKINIREEKLMNETGSARMGNNTSNEDVYYPEGYDPANQHLTDDGLNNGVNKPKDSKSNNKRSSTNKNKPRKHSAFYKWNRENGARITQPGDEHRYYKDQSNLNKLESGANYTVGVSDYGIKLSNLNL